MKVSNLREAILQENSKTHALELAAWAGQDAKRFKELVDLFLHDEYRVVQRAAWIISIIAATRSELIAPHLTAMVERMQQPDLPVAVKRNVVRILQHIDIPESLHGPVMNTCFDLLADVNEAIAVRVFSMTALANLAKHYPEIRNELKTIIEEELERAPTAAFISRGKKVLKSLNGK